MYTTVTMATTTAIATTALITTAAAAESTITTTTATTASTITTLTASTTTAEAASTIPTTKITTPGDGTRRLRSSSFNSRLQRIEDKLDSHLERMTRAESNIEWLRGHVKIATAVFISAVGGLATVVMKLIMGSR